MSGRIGLRNSPGGSANSQATSKPSARAPSEGRSRASPTITGSTSSAPATARSSRRRAPRGLPEPRQVVEAPARKERRAEHGEDDQPRVVTRVEDRQAADDLQERGHAQDDGQPQPAEQRDRDPLRPGPEDQGRGHEHQRKRADVKGTLDHEQPDRGLRRASPPVGQEDADGLLPVQRDVHRFAASVAQVGRVEDQLGERQKADRGQRGPRHHGAAEGERGNGDARRLGPPVAARLPQPQSQERRRPPCRTWKLDSACPARNWSPTTAASPAPARRRRTAHEPFGQQAAATG